MADVQRIDLLDPAEVARFGGIEIVAQGVVEGFLTGIHRSPFRGFSVEFTEHRAYQPGDELRYLDWKILARADRLFVKQFEQETNLRAMILVDASRSMAWRGAPNRLTKRAYADRLAAALALILLRQRDATGLITFDEVVRQVIPARVRTGQWTRLVRGLLDTPDGRGTAAEAAVLHLTGLLARRGLVVLVSAAAATPGVRHRPGGGAPPEGESPPIRYLSEAERQSARRLKLRHLLLLVLRTTLIALIVMAAARPLVRSRGPVAGEAHEPTALALVLDNSPSSGAVMDGRPLIERLKAAARAAIGRAATGDRLWLMLSDGVARAGSRDALLATVDSVVPGWRRLDLTEAVARASRLVDAEPLPGREGAGVGDLPPTTLGGGRAGLPPGGRGLGPAPPPGRGP